MIKVNNEVLGTERYSSRIPLLRAALFNIIEDMSPREEGMPLFDKEDVGFVHIIRPLEEHTSPSGKVGYHYVDPYLLELLAASLYPGQTMDGNQKKGIFHAQFQAIIRNEMLAALRGRGLEGEPVQRGYNYFNIKTQNMVDVLGQEHSFVFLVGGFEDNCDQHVYICMADVTPDHSFQLALKELVETKLRALIARERSELSYVEYCMMLDGDNNIIADLAVNSTSKRLIDNKKLFNEMLVTLIRAKKLFKSVFGTEGGTQFVEGYDEPARGLIISHIICGPTQEDSIVLVSDNNPASADEKDGVKRIEKKPRVKTGVIRSDLHRLAEAVNPILTTRDSMIQFNLDTTSTRITALSTAFQRLLTE